MTFYLFISRRVRTDIFWNVSRDGASPTSLGNLCQGFTTLSVKNFFLVSSENLLSFTLKPSPLVLLQQALPDGRGGHLNAMNAPTGV